MALDETKKPQLVRSDLKQFEDPTLGLKRVYKDQIEYRLLQVLCEIHQEQPTGEVIVGEVIERFLKKYPNKYQLVKVFRDIHCERPQRGATVEEAADLLSQNCASNCAQSISARSIGTLMCSQLGIQTSKIEGRYIISPGQLERLARLWKLYEVRSGNQPN